MKARSTGRKQRRAIVNSGERFSCKCLLTQSICAVGHEDDEVCLLMHVERVVSQTGIFIRIPVRRAELNFSEACMTVQRWSDEYEKFLNVNASLPPLELSEKVRAKVFASLKPSASWVLGKIALLHAMSVTVTLLFCPQFGINPLNTSGLMSVFMKFGSMFCMVPCGATVIGISLIFSALFLKREEFRYLKRLEYWVLPGLAFTTLGFFSVYGEWVMLEMVALWFAGAMLGGKAALELVTYFHDKQALVSI